MHRAQATTQSNNQDNNKKTPWCSCNTRKLMHDLIVHSSELHSHHIILFLCVKIIFPFVSVSVAYVVIDADKRARAHTHSMWYGVKNLTAAWGMLHLLSQTHTHKHKSLRLLSPAAHTQLKDHDIKYELPFFCCCCCCSFSSSSPHHLVVARISVWRMAIS